MAHELTVMAVGDVALAGGGGDYPSMTRAIPGAKEGAHRWLENVAPVLQQGDFTMGNLEGVIGDASLVRSDGKAGTGAGLIRMAPEAADVLKQAGFDLMCLANNHTMDYGNDGMIQTVTHLERVGIVASGGGRNTEEARRPAVLERDGVTVAVLSYSSVFMPGLFPCGENKPGIATVSVSTSYELPGNVTYAPGAPPRIVTTAKREDSEKMEDEVWRAKARADVVVVNWHWGLTRYANSFGSGLPIEDSLFYVLGYQEDMGRAAIDAGADLVVGHHPHALQGIEVYKGKAICYSLGILTMPFLMGANFGESTVILKGHIDRTTKQLTKVTLVPAIVPPENVQPRVAPPDEAHAIVTELNHRSRKYGVTFRLEGEEIAIA